MNIVFISPSYSPNFGGVEKHLNMINGKLIEDGHNVTVITSNRGDEFSAVESCDGVTIHRVSEINGRFSRKSFLLFLFKNKNLIDNADIIHYHDFVTFWAWGLLLNPYLFLKRKVSYITFHGWEGTYPPRKRVIFKRKLCQLLNKGNICVGHFIPKWYGTKPTIINYGGVDPKPFKLQSENKVLFVGRLEPDTGIMQYLSAWDKYLDDRYNLVILGDGSLKKSVEQFIEDNSFKSVSLEGFVNNVDEHISNSRVILTSGYLGILEALSQKKSVVSVYNNKLKEDYLKLIPNYQDIIWVANSEDCIRHSIIEAIKEEKKLSYEFALNNSWQKVKNDYYELWGLRS